ncbi:MAG: acetyl-CoA carboxylase biotin carboxyl carrier protein, partial [Planctomycetota bacterium]
AAAPAAGPAADDGDADSDDGTITIDSPMVGTFYTSSSPDAEAFVSVGDTVKPDDVVCIVEAMKVFNEIKADVSGKVVEVLVETGQAVEFGQPLFKIKP